MIGAIRTLDILLHPLLTVHCFGWRVFLQAMLSGRKQTFLSVLRGAKSFRAQDASMPSGLQQCVRLELHAKDVYAALAGLFGGSPDAARFFADMAEQEQDHADLLTLCWASLRRGRWKAADFDRWQASLDPLEKRLLAIKAAVDSIGGLNQALHLTMDVESSELNEIFRAVVAASDSEFVARLRPFQQAIETHISYIVLRLADLDPSLAAVSGALWDKLPPPER